jgi:hypothetical protein
MNFDLVNGIEHRKRKRSPSTVGQEYYNEKRVSSVKSRETLKHIQFREFMTQVETVLSELDPLLLR